MRAAVRPRPPSRARFRSRWWVVALSFAGVFAIAAPALALTRSPAYAGDFPDPFVLTVGKTSWAYSTGSAGRNLQAMSSPDLSHWTAITDPLAGLPAWADRGNTWAPGILPRGLSFVMYYTVRDHTSGRQCVSLATAATPAGPFQDRSTSPFVCQLDHAGSIDPTPFVAPNGAAYLLWKSEDNAIGAPPILWAQALSANGLGLVGTPVPLLSQTQTWQGGVIEGPSMHLENGQYYLFYGANQWNTPAASIGYAVCSSPLGPCLNQSVQGPWLSTHGSAVGPSGPSVFVDPAGTLKLAYHAWTGGVGYQNGGVRSLWIDRLSFIGGRPKLS